MPTYTAPKFELLISRAKALQADYIREVAEKHRQVNQERLHAALILAKVAGVLERMYRSEHGSVALHSDVMVGALLSQGQRIDNSYHVFNSEYQPGRIVDTGSIFNAIIKRDLHITPINKFETDFEKLIYLNKYYNFLIAHKPDFRLEFEAAHLNIDEVETELKQIIKSVFKKIQIKDILQSIPDEKSLDTKLSVIKKDYQNKCELRNKKANRIQDAEMLQALLAVIKKDRAVDQKNILTHSQRTKMGAILHYMRSTENEFHLRSGEFYKLCCKALNVNKSTDIDPSIRLECLSHFQTFINTNANQLEDAIKPSNTATYSLYLESLKKKLNENIAELTQTPDHHISKLTTGLSTMLALIAAAPGYGLGFIAGNALAESDYMTTAKDKFSTYTSKGMVLLVGDVGKHMGHKSASILIDTVMQRAFAKVFESLAMIIGGIVGGVIGLVVFDCSYATLRALGQLILHLKQHAPHLAKDIDDKVLECLLTLPESIFSEDDQAHLKEITKERPTALAQLDDSSDPSIDSSKGRLSFAGSRFSKFVPADVDSEEESCEATSKTSLSSSK